MGLFGKKKDEEDEEVKEPEVEGENTYDVEITCNNCENQETFEIPCGTKVEDFMKEKKCECCECNIQEE